MNILQYKKNHSPYRCSSDLFSGRWKKNIYIYNTLFKGVRNAKGLTKGSLLKQISDIIMNDTDTWKGPRNEALHLRCTNEYSWKYITYNTLNVVASLWQSYDELI